MSDPMLQTEHRPDPDPLNQLGLVYGSAFANRMRNEARLHPAEKAASGLQRSANEARWLGRPQHLGDFLVAYDHVLRRSFANVDPEAARRRADEAVEREFRAIRNGRPLPKPQPFAVDGPFAPWVSGIVRNANHEQHREDHNQPFQAAGGDEQPEFANPRTLDPCDQCDTEGQLWVVRLLHAIRVERLTPTERHVFLMRHAEAADSRHSLPSDTIGRILGKSSNAVDIAQHRANQKLNKNSEASDSDNDMQATED